MASTHLDHKFRAGTTPVSGVLVMPFVTALLWVAFAIWEPQFISPRNLSMLMIELSVTATLAIGMLLVILAGHIDLSAGSGVGLLGGVAAVLVFQNSWPAPLALTAALLVGLCLWGGMAWLVVRWRIQAFIISLGGLLVFKGAFWLVIQSSTVPVVGREGANLYSILTTWYVPPAYGLLALLVLGSCWSVRLWIQWRQRHRAGLAVESGEVTFLRAFTIGQTLLLVVLICNAYRGVPLAFLILMALAWLAHMLTQETAFGRNLYAVGGNLAAARACGVPVDRVVLLAFTLMGAVVAVTGFMQTAYAGASTTTVGELMELDAIAACVIGGASLKGGRGTVIGTLLGSLIMATLLNGMTLLAVAPEAKLIVRGSVLVLAVLVDVRMKRDS